VLYLTESQPVLPVIVDLDFRFDLNGEGRRFGDDFVEASWLYVAEIFRPSNSMRPPRTRLRHAGTSCTCPGRRQATHCVSDTTTATVQTILRDRVLGKLPLCCRPASTISSTPVEVLRHDEQLACTEQQPSVSLHHLLVGEVRSVRRPSAEVLPRTSSPSGNNDRAARRQICATLRAAV
jgi:hypothetical protein